MPSHLVPADSNNGLPAQYQPGGAAWNQQPSAPPSSTLSEQLGRFSSALRRYKWLILAVVAVGSSIGFALTRLVPPKYTVQGSIIIRKSLGNTGPITTPGIISDPNSWGELVRSFMVLDQVVERLGLYVTPEKLEDTSVVRQLRPSALLRPGTYEVRVDGETGRTTPLVRPASARGGEKEEVIESGVVGDSIGRPVGFKWQPAPGSLRPGTMRFRVITPRDAAVLLNRELVVLPVQTNTNLLRLTISGDRPTMIAAKMNTTLDEFVKVAQRVSKDNLTTIKNTVADQMKSAHDRLSAAENSLENFKVRTITLPNENTVVSPGTQMATNPVFNQFFQDNVQHKAVSRDLHALQSIFGTADDNGRLSIEALKSLPPMSPNSPLTQEIQKLEQAQAQLRAFQEKYTDAHAFVVNKKEEVRVLETQNIPLLARNAMKELEIQEAALRRSIEGQAGEMKEDSRTHHRGSAADARGLHRQRDLHRPAAAIFIGHTR
jgi:capsular polysaccharide biosynthesis protein